MIAISEIGVSITRFVAEPRLQPLGHLERAAERSDIFAKAKDVRIALHLFDERFANRVEIRDLTHDALPRYQCGATREGLANTSLSASGPAGCWRSKRCIGCGVHLSHDTRIDSIDLGLLDLLAVEQHAHVAIERIVLRGPAIDFAVRHVRLVVVLGVTAAPIRHEFDQRDAAARSRAIDRAPRRLVHGEHIVAVGAIARDAIARRFVDELLRRALLGHRRRVCVAVVLRDHDERTVLHGREIDSLVKCARARRAVAEVDEADAIFAAHFERERDAGHDRDHVAERRYMPDEPP